MASAEAEIRHVFGATCLTEESIGAAPPVIVKLSGQAILQLFVVEDVRVFKIVAVIEWFFFKNIE